MAKKTKTIYILGRKSLVWLLATLTAAVNVDFELTHWIFQNKLYLPILEYKLAY